MVFGAGLHRRGGGLDHNRSRPPALDRLWRDAHRSFGDAIADRLRRAVVLAGLYRGVSGDVPHRPVVHRAYCARRGRWGRGRARGSRPAGRAGQAGAGRWAMIIFDFVPIWTLIMGLAVFFYVLLDGFDLGVGILYNFAPDTASRNLLMNSIAPIWDGNETWLVLGGIGLLAAFPLAFAIILPAVYFPILVMLLALVFRGVAFEFRFRDVEHR